ncbi:ABC transporter ATP-binding protein [Neorhizobium lilium]|uniref:ABC transporter ATP-binding protein n=1 Tax=Neorhizobium lilium TaxID=2503024 RepID=A0A3S3RYL5_9HYPH|nr:ABC transporter ATP-binding protein [Neorhizobium lilium]RWX81657.1 ABC transporter ATP-binding protein [Neorhizobium lilium]
MTLSSQPADDAKPLVSLKSITKRFPGIVANDSISIDFFPGEVHVLLGENGAGKSTLVSMLSGLQQPSEGSIMVDGTEMPIASPQKALALGIGTVFQHSMLVPSLTLTDNVNLGGAWWKTPDREAIATRMEETARSIGVEVNPTAITSSLSLGEQQQAEIVRALMRGSRFLILDEATAMLTPKDAEKLGQLMRRLVAQGLAVIFITHKLNEAVAYGDRISVLRLGRKVGALGPDELKSLGPEAATKEIIRLMFGSNGNQAAVTAKADGAMRPRINGAGTGAAPVLEILALEVDDDSVPVSGIELKIGAGEIVGIAGIDGNGQKQLAEALAGQRPVKNGRIYLDGQPIEDLPIGARRHRGLRYVTDDRLGEGTVGAFPVSINLLLKQIGEAPFWRSGIEQGGAIADNARKQVKDYDIRTPDIETPAGKLSGGNIQKLLLARELTGSARAVIFAKPTYGLDLNNIAASRRRIREAADGGKAVIVLSTELDELIELSDRIAVMSQGRIVGIVENDGDARQKIGEFMSGVAA